MLKNKSILDLIVAIILTFIFAIILIKIDAFELFSEYSKNHEDYELDELVLLLLVGAFSALWYSYRRFKEIKILKAIIEENNIKLNKDNVKKDALLIEQIKMASLGEMIENIAHQWRQSLSIISAAASGLKIKKEFSQLDEDELDETLDNIVLNTQYLSKTIDTFRNYTKDIKTVLTFNVDNIINNALDIFKGNLNILNIDVILDLNVNIKSESYPNELIEVLINILNNSKDVFEIKNIEKRYIFISSKVLDKEVQINIKDNGKGISESIISKIFEPYFTTKHNYKGTGLGLYLSYKIINERLKGSLYVKNSTFQYHDNEFKGAEFIIKIPIKI